MKKQQGTEEKQSGIMQPVIFVISIMLVICALGALSFKGSYTKNGSTADGVPGWDAEVTAENVLALLKAYDKDGFFLVDQAKERQENFLSYYDSAFNFDGSPIRLMDALNTVVHEEFHMYSISDEEAGADKRRFYVGNGESVILPLTEVFPTKEMADSVPENCRTSRFSDYVSEPAEGMESNAKGVYGLLNEFCAYRWELHNDIAMFDYCNQYGDGVNALDKYITLCVSPREAYAEFKYYILHYLIYAKEHHPEMYQEIMANDVFRSVYRDHEEGFRKNIGDFEKSLDQIQTTLESWSYTVKRTQDDFLIYDKDGNESGANLQYINYNTLIEELKKEPYVSMHEELVK